MTIQQLQELYPSVPVEAYDIEASEEMAIQWLEMFGC